MSLFVPRLLADACTHPAVKEAAAAPVRADQREADVPVPSEDVSREVVQAVRDLATAHPDTYRTYVKNLDALLETMGGRQRAVTSATFMGEMLRAYLNHDVIDGWVYLRDFRGRHQPYRVESIESTYHGVEIRLATVLPGSRATVRDTVTIGDRRGLPQNVLARHGLAKETADLRRQYVQTLTEFLPLVSGGHGLQCLATGPVLDSMTARENQPAQALPDSTTLVSRRVVVESLLGDDVVEEVRALPSTQDPVFAAIPVPCPTDTLTPERLPLRLVARVFDIGAEREWWAPADVLARYVYDPDIRERLILPRSHGQVIDVLAASTVITGADVIHGKASGNLILCKGAPGIGKTLTAEVIAEVLQRPLYTVDAGSLLQPAQTERRGSNWAESTTSTRSIRQILDDIFTRVRRWDAVLLFDEADVLLGARGDDLHRNRVTAEMLRALERFERLAFLTTNRPDDIDEAFVSRCRAVILYQAPTGRDAVRVWMSLGRLLGENVIDEATATTLSQEYPGLPPRDMKQLLLFAEQMAASTGQPVTLDAIRGCAPFRGLA